MGTWRKPRNTSGRAGHALAQGEGAAVCVLGRKVRGESSAGAQMCGSMGGPFGGGCAGCCVWLGAQDRSRVGAGAVNDRARPSPQNDSAVAGGGHATHVLPGVCGLQSVLRGDSHTLPWQDCRACICLGFVDPHSFPAPAPPDPGRQVQHSSGGLAARAVSDDVADRLCGADQ